LPVTVPALPVLKKVPVKSLRSTCTDLVIKDSPYSLGSTTGININTLVRNMTSFPQQIVSQLVGHLLGDGALVMSRTSVTPAFIMTQTLKPILHLNSPLLRRGYQVLVWYPTFRLAEKGG
jgi:hypothetical protein